MGRLGINECDVEQAIEQLTLRGKNPTIDAIREVLGRGSKTTISKHFNLIKNQLKPQQALPDRLAQAVQQLWAHMHEMADERIRQMEEQALVQKEQDRHRIDLLSAEKNTLTTLLDEVSRKSSSLSEALQESIQQCSELTALHQKAQQQLELQEKMLLDGKSENKRLHELASHMQENLEHYQQAVQKQRLEHTMQSEKLQQQWKVECATLEEKNKELLIEVNRSHQACAEIKTKLNDAIEQKNECMNKIEKCEHELAQQKNQVMLLEERGQNMKIVIEEQKQQQVDAQRKLSDADKELAVSLHQLNQFANKINTVQDELATLKDENRFLLQEKHELQGQLKHMEQAYLKFMQSSKDHV